MVMMGNGGAGEVEGAQLKLAPLSTITRIETLGPPLPRSHSPPPLTTFFKSQIHYLPSHHESQSFFTRLSDIYR